MVGKTRKALNTIHLVLFYGMPQDLGDSKHNERLLTPAAIATALLKKKKKKKKKKVRGGEKAHVLSES